MAYSREKNPLAFSLAGEWLGSSVVGICWLKSARAGPVQRYRAPSYPTCLFTKRSSKRLTQNPLNR